jgi:hypothetical protein
MRTTNPFGRWVKVSTVDAEGWIAQGQADRA